MTRDFQNRGRSPVMATEAAVAASHPLATAAALEMLHAGGNAVDAAIAASAVQCVVEPHMTGIGGDCFVLYAPAGGARVMALNGSGRAPEAATADRLRAEGLDEIPRQSAHAVTVPGALAAWARLHADHGSLPWDRLLARAIGYAEQGYAVHPRVAWDWAREAWVLRADPGASAVLLPGGSAPAMGSRHAQPALANTLRLIAREGVGPFYQGEIAERLVRFLRGRGGLHGIDDFATTSADWVEPISSTYRGCEVLECPPNGQGLAALLILNILSGFDLSKGSMSEADRIHLIAEATKLAYHHRDALIGDPSAMAVPPETLLGVDVAENLRSRIDMRRAAPPTLWTEPEHKDTIYLCVVDRQGNAISFINSLFHLFGSGLVEPETGVLLQSRGTSFNLRPGHPNAIGPRKRPMHTIIPGMLRKDGRILGPFGVMGGHYQAAGQAALVSGLFDRGLDVQAAIDAPRFFAWDGVLQLEAAIGEETARDLARRGHRIERPGDPLGGGQAILIDHARGILTAGSDPRKDGMAAGF
jgi:gamma-glutamyltranspeptidase / glutathione hydrolase